MGNTGVWLHAGALEKAGNHNGSGSLALAGTVLDSLMGRRLRSAVCQYSSTTVHSSRCLYYCDRGIISFIILQGHKYVRLEPPLERLNFPHNSISNGVLNANTQTLIEKINTPRTSQFKEVIDVYRA